MLIGPQRLKGLARLGSTEAVAWRKMRPTSARKNGDLHAEECAGQDRRAAEVDGSHQSQTGPLCRRFETTCAQAGQQAICSCSVAPTASAPSRVSSRPLTSTTG